MPRHQRGASTSRTLRVCTVQHIVGVLSLVHAVVSPLKGPKAQVSVVPVRYCTKVCRHKLNHGHYGPQVSDSSASNFPIRKHDAGAFPILKVESEISYPYSVPCVFRSRSPCPVVCQVLRSAAQDPALDVVGSLKAKKIRLR
ncbi:uncharacterized protein CCOS01_02522 [Colletotrichum costaricense]|uniref:Uncharacterized protein n=1 Tax=Colletotrichum costaricense TaxID=1209916 RepID=A0AAJ0E5G5_9PEZI|nr:uncharacterized protein CCOS01_02522 [Colletotrichum costaricense]KAK1537202.1 hypothetical protein CCOS01_02522 [Colletotrichum costaricense]